MHYGHSEVKVNKNSAKGNKATGYKADIQEFHPGFAQMDAIIPMPIVFAA